MKLTFSLLLLAMSSMVIVQNPLLAATNPAPNAGAPSHIASQTDLSGTAISACGSITSPGSYYLSKDLSCPGTALLISGPGIDLNLNGHTIAYGTAGGTMGAVFGIENDACWDTVHKARALPCDNKSAGIAANIYGGSIVQSTKAPAFSHALFFGENNNADQTIDIHNVTITIQQPGTQAFFSNFQGGQIILEHNTVYDNVKSINYPGQGDLSSRSQYQGQAIHVDNSKIMRSPDKIDNNKIVGSPQGGIRDTSIGAMIYQNDISQNSLYANDFCVDVPGSDQKIYSNYCHPVNGRGFHVDGEGTDIYNNVFVVTEAPVIREYGGCEDGGAYGIQLEQDIQQAGNVVVTGNNGTLNTGACGGGVLSITHWPAGTPATIKGNTWTVDKTSGADKLGSVIYLLDTDNLSDVVFGGDALKTNDLACAGINWDGAQNFKASLAGCTAPYAMATVNGPGTEGSFTLTGAPNVNLGCGTYSKSTGTINGKAVKCPK